SRHLPPDVLASQDHSQDVMDNEGSRPRLAECRPLRGLGEGGLARRSIVLGLTPEASGMPPAPRARGVWRGRRWSSGSRPRLAECRLLRRLRTRDALDLTVQTLFRSTGQSKIIGPRERLRTRHRPTMSFFVAPLRVTARLGAADRQPRR